MELIQMLTSQLGVSEQQAKGGSGLLFKLAKDKLDDGEFGQLAGAIPQIEALMGEAPETGGGMAGALGGLASSLGGNAGKLGTLATLASGFQSLDLDPTMVRKFAPVIMSFVQSQGGEGVQELLKKAMK